MKNPSRTISSYSFRTCTVVEKKTRRIYSLNSLPKCSIKKVYIVFRQRIETRLALYHNPPQLTQLLVKSHGEKRSSFGSFRNLVTFDVISIQFTEFYCDRTSNRKKMLALFFYLKATLAETIYLAIFYFLNTGLTVHSDKMFFS